jgi:phage-related protein (TIGR01555 family)
VTERFDSYTAVMGMVMAQRERSGQGTFQTTPLEELYASDGLAAVIVDRPAEDAMASGFKVQGDEDNTVLNEVDRLDAIQHFTDALRWARLHGGAVILPLMDDGSTLDQPIAFDRIRRINDLMVYPISAITASAQRYRDPRLNNYGEPIFYTIRPRSGQPFDVHESRLLKVSGEALSYAGSQGMEIPWQGRSVLQGCYEPLMNYRAVLRLSREILRRKQQAVYKMKGMAETLAIQETGLDGAVILDGKALVMQRLNLTDMVRGTETTVGIDGEDDFTVLDTNLGGIDAVLAGFRLDLAAKARMPVPVVFGEGFSGMGNSGIGEQALYHGLLRSMQERQARPALERLVSMIWAQSEVRASEPEKWRIVFNPLWSPSEKEVADAEAVRATARKTAVEALMALVDGQLVMADEGRKFVAATWPEYQAGDAPAPDMMPDDDQVPE